MRKKNLQLTCLLFELLVGINDTAEFKFSIVTALELRFCFGDTCRMKVNFVNFIYYIDSNSTMKTFLPLSYRAYGYSTISQHIRNGCGIVFLLRVLSRSNCDRFGKLSYNVISIIGFLNRNYFTIGVAISEITKKHI